MKRVFQILTMMFSLLFSIQVSAETNEQRIAKIQEKAKKLQLKQDAGVLQSFDFSANKKAYFLSYNGHSCNVYFKDGMPEAYAVCGEIYQLYDQMLNGEWTKSNGRTTQQNPKLFIGLPISDAFKTPQKEGVGQHFEGGSIYWSQPTGAHEVHGNIRDKWKALGWENSFLGFPVMNETATPDGFGKFNFFEGGAIYYHPHLGTFAVPKMIIEVWKKEGWEKGKLGYPVSDEIIKNNNSIQKFEFGAVISVKGAPYQSIFNGTNRQRGLYAKWLETGGENSFLGDLVLPNRSYPRNQFQYFAEFQYGYIYESFIKGTNKTDAFVIKKGPIFNYYASKKWEQGSLGLPVSDEQSLGNGNLKQDFQGGTIYYTPSLGAYEKK